MRMSDLIAAMEAIAPPSFAESWDNVGLILGRSDAPIGRGRPVLLTIDFTEDVLEEAKEASAAAVISYHPPVFHAVKRVVAEDARTRVALGAIEAGMAVYSPHTALDAAPGGMADWLCDMLAPEGATGSIGDRRALNAQTSHDPRQTHKIVTFVPESHVDQVRNALATIGAGRIGEYELCSFGMRGRGTFRGGAGTKPAVGEAGREEQVEEVRLEMVCPGDALPLAAEILRQFHPYEEPAWDIYPLAPKADRSVGAGRRLVLDRPATARELALRLKKSLGVDAVKIAQASDEAIDHVGVCPGSGGALLEAAIRDGCRAFVSGEMTHHEALSAVRRGCSILLAGHTNTERGYLRILAQRLGEALPGVTFVVSAKDRTLFRTL